MQISPFVRNRLVDRLTGVATTVGPVLNVDSSSQLRAFTGAALGFTQASAYDEFPMTGNGVDWQAAAGGVSMLSGMKAKTSSLGSPSGTISFVQLFRTITDSNSIVIADMTAGLPGSGAECILDSLTAGSLPINVTNLSLKLLPSGDLKANDAILNAILDCLLRGGAAPNMGGSGFIQVYSGTPPASAGDPVTGTLLATFSTTTASWAAASGGSAALAASLTDASADGTGTAGYARWTKGSFCLQGTAGTSGTTFLLDSASVVAGQQRQLVGATISL